MTTTTTKMQLHSMSRQVLAEHTIECTGPGEVTCRACRDAGWMSWSSYRSHLADVLLSVATGGGDE